MTKKVNIPFEERPQDCTDVMWRYSQNPVIGRYAIPTSNSIFNSAVVPFEDGFAGVFRCDNKAVQMNILLVLAKTELTGRSITTQLKWLQEIPI
nr:hypothetical protein [uncultured Draconibacterium sp.]